MIKRHYFIAIEKFHDDGRGSFSYLDFRFTRTSLFPDHDRAYSEAISSAKEKMKDIQGTKYRVISFNQI